MTNPNSGLGKRLKKSLSFIPLPVLDLVMGTATRLKRSQRKRESQKRSPFKKVQVKQLDPSDPYSPWFRTGKPPRTYLTDLDSIDSIIWRVLSQNGTKDGMGLRKLISKEVEWLPDGTTRIHRQYDDKYTWFTYFEISTRLDNLRKGLMALGVKKNDRVTIFMESSMERKMVTASLMRVGGVPALVPPDRRLISTHYMINQLDSAVMIVSAATAMQMPALCQHLTHTRHVIVAQDEVNGVLEEIPFDKTCLTNFYDEPLEVMTYLELEALGQRSPDVEPTAAHPDDVAFLVFTSGSTG